MVKQQESSPEERLRAWDAALAISAVDLEAEVRRRYRQHYPAEELTGCELEDYEGAVPANAPQLQVTYEYADWSLPFLVAMKKGYFRKRGIDIKPLKVGDLPGLRLGDMDVINGHAFSLMGERGASPRSIRFVHPFFYTKDGPMITGFLVKKTAQITKWGDFQGRKSTQLALRSLGDLGLIKKITTVRLTLSRIHISPIMTLIYI